jgi:hypothetical protein
MKYFLILNLAFTSYFLNRNLIFLSPALAEYTFNNKFNLDREDVRLIQYYFSQRDYTNHFNELPSSTNRPRVNIFFAILKDPEDPRWVHAYLHLLEIVPDLFIEEIGC